MTKMLTETKRLWDLGFGIIWLHPKSKQPIETKWTTGDRHSWETLKASYKEGYNAGVRLGQASRLGKGYLTVIDVDVKSTEERHQIEAHNKVLELFKVGSNPVQVASGRGQGSGHIYATSHQPAQSYRAAVSDERVKVKMPKAPINKAQRELLSEEDLNEGWRIRPAWEISVMGEGAQVVVPPSIHPDTNRYYTWLNNIGTGDELPLLEFKGKQNNEKVIVEDFEFVNVDLTLSNLDSGTVDLIITGDGFDDQSAALLVVAAAMVKAGFQVIEMLSVLTDKTYALGRVAYKSNHANTNSRKKAAEWIFKYTIAKARRENDAAKVFEEQVVTVGLNEEDAEKQHHEIVLSGNDWQSRIERNMSNGINSGRPFPSLKNVVLIIENETSKDIFKRNIFAYRDFYSANAPWGKGNQKGKAIDDDDIVAIIYWLSIRYRVEPKKTTVEDAVSLICSQNWVNPVKDWLDQLAPWDGVTRLDTWLVKNFEAQGNPEYLAQVFRKWVFAMVMRIYEPGTQMDWMPIFEGIQGIGKSSFGRILVEEKHFLDWLPSLSSKDAALSLSGHWCVEMGELATLNKNELEVVKAFLSRRVDKLRPPYGKRLIEAPRTCVFFGTTNKATYLKDESGNRRFKPIQVGNLDFKKLMQEREQLFAEALFLYLNELEERYPLDTTGEARSYELDIQKIKMVEDESSVMIEALMDFFLTDKIKPENERFPFNKFKMSRLFDPWTSGGGPFKTWKFDGRNIQFATKALKALKAERRTSAGYDYWMLPLPTNIAPKEGSV